MDKLLSIVIPTFNRASFLEANLSILTDYCNKGLCFDVIVSNNGSCDETSEIIKKYLNGPLKLTYIDHENIGYDRNVATALSQVCTNYYFLLGDCYTISFDSLAAIIKELQEKTPDMIVINAARNLISGDAHYSNINKFIIEQGWHITNLSATVVRSDAIKKDLFSRYYDTQFIHYGLLMEFLCAKECVSIYFIGDVLLERIIFNNKEKESSWQARSFYTFGKSWTNLILSLPHQIDLATKLLVIKSHNDKTKLFGVSNVVRLLNKYGDAYKRDYYKHKAYLNYTSRLPICVYELIMSTPQFIIRCLPSIMDFIVNIIRYKKNN